jgi:transposase
MRASEAMQSVIGIDLGDRFSYVHELDMQTGETLSQARLPTSPETFGKHFASIPQARITLEVGAHSPWSSRLLQGLGHQVVVANPRTLALIHSSTRKRDELDAEKLARLARLDPKLLSPIRHRSLQAHADRTRLKVREALVRSRTSLIIHTRNMLKAFGIQIPKCASTCFHKRVLEHLPEELKPAVAPLLESLKVISHQIYEMEKGIEKLSKERYPETARLRQVVGVGPLLSLAFVLTLDDPSQFIKSRDVGSYLGLVPKQRQSGERDPALGISKQGDKLLRTLLVQAVQYQLSSYGPDCDLKRFGLKLIEKGGPKSRNRAVIGVARKLAVLLHRLWTTGEVYDPFYNSNHHPAQAA